MTLPLCTMIIMPTHDLPTISLNNFLETDMKGEEESDSDSEKVRTSVPSLATLLKGGLIVQRESGEGIQPPTISNKQLRDICEGLERVRPYISAMPYHCAHNKL